jgi:hypothetical protein
MPWRRIDLGPIDGLASVPSMLWPDERRFLYWIGRDVWTGRGEIVDLGAFLGGSAACLAAGVRDGQVAAKAGRVHSYDDFRFASFHRPFLPDFEGKDGDSTLPAFHATTAPYAGIVTATSGDICAQPWEKPIEVLFLDFTQTVAHHDAVARTFYPHLVPGGLLVQQDYIFVVAYWLHVWMELYASHFEVVEQFVRSSTAAFRLKEPLPPSAFAPLRSQVTAADMHRLMDRSLDRYRPLFKGSDDVYLLLLRCARGRLTLHEVGPEAARREASALPQRSPHVVQLQLEIDHAEARAAAATPGTSR